MTRLKVFALFWYDFIVGDDWRLAVGVIGAIAVLLALSRHRVHPWWLLPLAVPPVLAVSLLQATRPKR